jgi:Cytochrome c7 and related cytochrome c
MAAIFTSRANLYTQFILLGFGLLCVALAGLVWVAPNTNYATGIGFTPIQPVPFSHQHHVSGLGLDCRYCHTAVETSADAGMPPTHTCMTCHSQIWTNAAILAPVRQSLAQNKPLQWNRVYTLPDYVYFDHSIHIVKGVGCTECHGPIGDMPLTYQATSLDMGWCLDCHRNPAPHLRPANAVFDPHWQRTASTPSPAALMAQYHIHVSSLTDCSVCHR